MPTPAMVQAKNGVGPRCEWNKQPCCIAPLGNPRMDVMNERGQRSSEKAAMREAGVPRL